MSGNVSIAYRPDIQGLRAIAVLAVLAAHISLPGFAGGFVGVDVFFVLSGYLITGLLLKEQLQYGSIQLIRFWARRLKRLLPALAVMLVATALVAKWLLTDTEFINQSRSLPYAATWTSNLYFLFRSVDYFDELAAKDLFLHTWSLGVEEQFYILWPLFLWLIFVLGQPKSAAKSSQLFFWLLIAILTSLSFSVYASFQFPKSAFYLMPSRIWQFALGGLVFLITNSALQETKAHKNQTTRIMGSLFLISGMLLILISVVLLDKNTTYPGFWALMPSSGAGLALMSGAY